MSTIAWLLILAAIIIGRQVVAGRVLNISGDLSDAFLAITRGDYKGLAEVFSRTGDANVADMGIPNATTPIAGLVTSGAQGVVRSTLAKAAVDLGSKAKGYRFTATGPDYYDCSGLMWRAAQHAGFSGPRFTTENVLSAKGFARIGSGQGVGDIVLWPAGSGGLSGHMGVITGADEFYSARSVRSGIGYSKISTFRKTQPVYVRFNG